jgi:hypothetical protein
MTQWDASAADLVARLSPAEFEAVEDLRREMTLASEMGLYQREAAELVPKIERASAILEPLTRLTWFDRRVWRL